MVIRRSGLDGLPLVTVLVAATVLVVWAGLGAKRGLVSAAGDPSLDLGAALAPKTFLGEAVVGADDSFAALVAWAESSGDARHAVSTDEIATPPHPPITVENDAERNDIVLLSGDRRRGEGALSAGRPDGRWTLWRQDGTRLAAGSFSQGLPDGAWTWWHNNGEVSSQGNFAAGAASGMWREWHRDGAPKLACTYVDGAREGSATEWWQSGAVRSEGDYATGMREGDWRTWYENGQPRAEGSYHEGLREGAWREWHDNGDLRLTANYHRGRPDGDWVQRYANGQVESAGFYVDGRRSGEWSFFASDGTPDPRSGIYVNGRKDREP